MKRGRAFMNNLLWFHRGILKCAAELFKEIVSVNWAFIEFWVLIWNGEWNLWVVIVEFSKFLGSYWINDDHQTVLLSFPITFPITEFEEGWKVIITSRCHLPPPQMPLHFSSLCVIEDWARLTWGLLCVFQLLWAPLWSHSQVTKVRSDG